MEASAVIACAAAVLSLGIAAAVLARERKSTASRLLAAAMACLGLESLMVGFGLFALEPEAMLAWQRRRFVPLAVAPALWITFGLVYARGEYRHFLRQWRLLLWTAFALPLGVALGLNGNLLTVAEPKPLTGFWVLPLAPAGSAVMVLYVLGLLVALVNFERTMRAAIGVMRWRIKFMILGLGVLLALRLYSATHAILYSALDLSLEGLNAGGAIVACGLVTVSLLRSRLLGVDLYPSGRFLRGSLVVLVAGAYFLCVGVLAKLVVYFGGAAGFPFKAFLLFLAFVLLALLLFSDRARQWLRRFMSRHLHVQQYDYRGVWRTFTQRTALARTQQDFCRSLAEMVSETLQALSVTVWVVDDTGEQLLFGGSTNLSSDGARGRQPGEAEARAVIAEIGNHTAAIELQPADEGWRRILREMNPGQFQVVKEQACIPLRSSSALHGIMLLGDRVNALPYSTEEHELLSVMAEQAAAYLHGLQLSESLARARQMEAFQAMSTFFVHDLKNTTATLSLMLQNLPKHFEDPAFRKDALRSIGTSVDKMNTLIRRLTLLRGRLELHLESCDLSALAAAALDDMQGKLTCTVERELTPDLVTRLDPQQVQRVVTNLLLNARDAVDAAGTVGLRTYRHDGWAVLAVSDNGVGMDREFVRRSLFRPFQSTKKDGMGIGLFQTKTILEAHKGKIEVETESGRGTTFRVRLPLQGETVETENTRS